MGSQLEVIPATLDQEPILANLLELYAHDFSEFHSLEIGEDGRFGYPPMALYWSEPDRYPFLVRINGNLAGLVLVKRGNETVWDMAEFFIIRGCRRRGMGTRAAHEVFARFPGLWAVRVMQTNSSAQRFWMMAISAFIGEAAQPVQTEIDGSKWMVFSFESKPAAGAATNHPER